MGLVTATGQLLPIAVVWQTVRKSAPRAAARQHSCSNAQTLIFNSRSKEVPRLRLVLHQERCAARSVDTASGAQVTSSCARSNADRRCGCCREAVAEHFSVSTRTIEHWQRDGMPHYRCGGVRFFLSECTHWHSQFRIGTTRTSASSASAPAMNPRTKDFRVPHAPSGPHRKQELRKENEV
ncbi:MAG: hypothetical protein H0U43_04910 [Chthoniobacterales bacterium]|nr:hypothetical protein [Chthoniobacterales bacterium]